MKVKVIVLDHNKEYIQRLGEALQYKFSRDINFSFFSDEEIFYREIDSLKTDLILFDETIKINKSRIPNGVVCGYFCEKTDVREIEGYPAIFKYQNVENIHKRIVELYADYSGKKFEYQVENSNYKIVFFTSAQGGCGTSVAAAAYALRSAAEKQSVLYINLERFGNPDRYFFSDDNRSFSDIIYRIKSKKENLQVVLANYVQKDDVGVSFFKTCKNAYDMLELEDEEIWILLDAVIQTGIYEKVVIDLSGDMNRRISEIMKRYASEIVYVTDGSDVGRDKFGRFCESAKVIEERDAFSILKKTVLIYNRFHTKGSRQLKESPVPVLGGISCYEGLTDRKLAEKIASLNVLENL